MERRSLSAVDVMCFTVLCVRMSFDQKMLFTSMPKGKVTNLLTVLINKAGNYVCVKLLLLLFYIVMFFFIALCQMILVP